MVSYSTFETACENDQTQKKKTLWFLFSFRPNFEEYLNYIIDKNNWKENKEYEDIDERFKNKWDSKKC